MRRARTLFYRSTTTGPPTDAPTRSNAGSNQSTRKAPRAPFTMATTTIALFDVDGTLTPARKEATAEMLQFLKALRGKVRRPSRFTAAVASIAARLPAPPQLPLAAACEAAARHGAPAPCRPPPPTHTHCCWRRARRPHERSLHRGSTPRTARDRLPPLPAAAGQDRHGRRQRPRQAEGAAGQQRCVRPAPPPPPPPPQPPSELLVPRGAPTPRRTALSLCAPGLQCWRCSTTSSPRMASRPSSTGSRSARR